MEGLRKACWFVDKLIEVEGGGEWPNYPKKCASER